MALDHLIAIARDHFGIQSPEDWQRVRPEWILQLHGCSQATLDHIRLYLAARGLTLRDDQTPTFWQTHLESAKIGGQMGSRDLARVEAFTILIDSQEKKPFTFQGLYEAGAPIIVPTQWKSLGPTHGDYSILGLEGDCHLERKSLEDAQGTFLAHGERRERWLRTLEFLASIPCGSIVVECTFGEMVATARARGQRSTATLQKTLHRQVLAWQQDYRVPFYFCDSPRFAEKTAFAILRRYFMAACGINKNPVKNDLEIIATL